MAGTACGFSRDSLLRAHALSPRDANDKPELFGCKVVRISCELPSIPWILRGHMRTDIGFHIWVMLWALLKPLCRIHVLWAHKKLTVAHVWIWPKALHDEIGLRCYEAEKQMRRCYTQFECILAAHASSSQPCCLLLASNMHAAVPRAI